MALIDCRSNCAELKVMVVQVTEHDSAVAVYDSQAAAEAAVRKRDRPSAAAGVRWELDCTASEFLKAR
jgi:hypothetical protein